MQKKIIISPFSGFLNKQNNAKNYPYWSHLIKLLRKENCLIWQVGTKNESDLGADERYCDLPMENLKFILEECDFWISVDNFFQHFAHYYNKQGVVIFSKSDPELFGYKENFNILKDRKYLREDQFNIWNDEKLNIESFVLPIDVINSIKGKRKWL